MLWTPMSSPQMTRMLGFPFSWARAPTGNRASSAAVATRMRASGWRAAEANGRTSRNIVDLLEASGSLGNGALDNRSSYLVKGVHPHRRGRDSSGQYRLARRVEQGAQLLRRRGVLDARDAERVQEDHRRLAGDLWHVARQRAVAIEQDAI